jgi:hypothetical protein
LNSFHSFSLFSFSPFISFSSTFLSF